MGNRRPNPGTGFLPVAWSVDPSLKIVARLAGQPPRVILMLPKVEGHWRQ